MHSGELPPASRFLSPCRVLCVPLAYWVVAAASRTASMVQIHPAGGGKADTALPHLVPKIQLHAQPRLPGGCIFLGPSSPPSPGTAELNKAPQTPTEAFGWRDRLLFFFSLPKRNLLTDTNSLNSYQ